MDQKLYDSYVKILKTSLFRRLAVQSRLPLHMRQQSTRSTRTDAGIDRALLQWKHHQKRKGC